jgi:cysteine-rich repeat protein
MDEGQEANAMDRPSNTANQREGIRRSAWLLAALLTVAVGLVHLVRPAHAQLDPGDILVVDFEGGEDGKGLLFRVNPATGARTVLSDFGDAGQGTAGQSPFGVTVADVNTVFVVDSQGIGGAGVLFRVDPTNGQRTVLSDFGDPSQGPPGVEPVGVVPGAGGLVVVDTEAGTDGRGALFRVHPVTGARTLLSDFGNAAQGPLGKTPTGIARGAGGTILVMDPDAGTDVPGDTKVGGNGALFRIDPLTGARAVLSDFGNTLQGPTGTQPAGVAMGPGGVILVGDPEAGTGANGALFSVDPVTGVRTVLSDFGNAAKGATGTDPIFLAISASGAILVTDDDGGTDLPNDGIPGGSGALFTVNPTNGNRTLLSNFGNLLQGPSGVNPVGVAVVPLTQPGDILVIDFLAGTNGAGVLFSVNPTTGRRTVLSDFGNPQQGPVAGDPVHVAVSPRGEILVVEEDFGGAGAAGSGALFLVDSLTGARTLLSNFANATQGPVLGQARGVAPGPGDKLLVVTGGTGTNRGGLFLVDSRTGARSLVSDFASAAKGPIGARPEAVALVGDTEALVVDPDAPPPGGGAANGLLFRVDLVTGVRTALSNFTDGTQGPTGENPNDLATEADGRILVIDPTAGPQNVGLLTRVDPLTGARTLLSNMGDPAKGPTARNPLGIALEADGGILVIDNLGRTDDTGTLFRVNPADGTRAVVSDFGALGQGPPGAQPVSVAVFPRNGVLTFCGDGVLDPGEQCDDRNVASGDGCSATCRLEDAGGRDRYLCYQARQQKGSLSTFRPPPAATFADRFETLTGNVVGPRLICNPADVGGSGYADPATHFRTYRFKAGQGSPKFEKRTGVALTTEFGALTVNVKARADMMVPASKSLSGAVAPPAPGTVDRYRCYTVAVTSDAGDEPLVVVSDQFRQTKTYRVIEPKRLCTPVGMNADPMVDPAADLLCFAVKPARNQPKHVRVASVHAVDEFANEVLQTSKELELCVPAETAPVP